MANFTAADVKRLRDATGAGMMDSKKALEETDGDFDKAVEVLRIKGAAKAAKRGDERTASNGLVAAADGRDDRAELRDRLRRQERPVPGSWPPTSSPTRPPPRPATSRRCWPQTLADGRTVAEAIDAVAAVIGEKLELRRVAVLDGARSRSTCTSARATCRRRSACWSRTTGDDPRSARGAAMQIAAMRPQYVTRDEVPGRRGRANERRIAEATAREEGKPEAALPKIVEGRVNGFFKDVVLLEQASVQDQQEDREGAARRGRRDRHAASPASRSAPG